LQTSDATGAAQSQLGPDAQAAIVYLNKHAGLSYGKIADTFDKFFAIDVTRGACAQIVLRAGRRLQPIYEQIQQRLQTATHLTPDETGWRIGGRPAWLHGWVGDDGTACYVIDPCRGGEVLAEVIGWDWSGTLTHDGCPSYDRFEEATHQQCVDHALRRARKLAEQHTGAAQTFPNQVIDLFQDALAVRDQFLDKRLDKATLQQAHEDYTTRLLELTERPRANEANETLAKHLYQHGEQWFMFLVDASIPATNHRAEQALKGPIVISMSENMFYYVKGHMKGRKKKAKKMVTKVAEAIGETRIDALAAILKVKGLANEVGGLKKLRALVDALSE